MTLQAESFLDRVRRVELGSARALFPVGASVLEIGGGNGYQAAVLASWGMQVVSIDIDIQGSWIDRFFNVCGYDGKTLPVADGTVDVIFSSNVLEHIVEANLLQLFAEMRRVLAPMGFAVHLMPTPVWRFWTIVAHYPWLILRLFRGKAGGSGVVQPSMANVIERRGLMGLLKRAFCPVPHGEYPNCFAELFSFRERAWRKRFVDGGFRVIRCYPAGIFYTGYTLFPGLPISWRRFLSRLLGSACRAYLIKPAASLGNNGGTLMSA
jgi:SAM-dependent methyltransferase